MGLYNTVIVPIRCPLCHQLTVAHAEVRLGLCDLRTYQIGQSVGWVERKAPQNGGRPSDGNAVLDYCRNSGNR